MIKAIRSLGLIAVGMMWACSAGYGQIAGGYIDPIIIPQDGGYLYQPSCPGGTFVSLQLCPTCGPYYLAQSFPLYFPANPSPLGVYLTGEPPYTESLLNCGNPLTTSYTVPICQSGTLQSCPLQIRRKISCPSCRSKTPVMGVRG